MELPKRGGIKANDLPETARSTPTTATTIRGTFAVSDISETKGKRPSARCSYTSTPSRIINTRR